MNQGDSMRADQAIGPIMTVDEVERFLDDVFPELHHSGRLTTIEALGPLSARVRLTYSARNLRPGGTVSGPAMMALADHAMYVAVIAHIGPVALAVTTHLSIDFLRKPAQKDLIAEVEIVKLGKRLAVGQVTLISEGGEAGAPVAVVSCTYSIPPR